MKTLRCETDGRDEEVTRLRGRGLQGSKKIRPVLEEIIWRAKAEPGQKTHNREQVNVNVSVSVLMANPLADVSSVRSFSCAV